MHSHHRLSVLISDIATLVCLGCMSCNSAIALLQFFSNPFFGIALVILFADIYLTFCPFLFMVMASCFGSVCQCL